NAARSIGQDLVEKIAVRERPSELIVVDTREGLALGLQHALEVATMPLALISSALECWSDAHLDPLLAAIDRSDVVVGCRRTNPISALFRLVGSLRWRVLFAIPVRDAYSPCTLFRRERLAQMIPQSSSSFLGVELLAKATFIGQLIDEVAVPRLTAL